MHDLKFLSGTIPPTTIPVITSYITNRKMNMLDSLVHEKYYVIDFATHNVTMVELVFIRRIEEYLKCAICLELFQDPRNLLCQDTFCHECM